MAAVIARDFSGKMNMDSHLSKVGKKDYVDALNITRNAEGMEDVVANIVGNQSVAYSMPAGVPVTIGAREDKLRNKIIECIYHPDGYHTIVVFDKTAGTRTKLIQSKTDTGGVDILNFSTSHRIRGIDIIHRDISEGDLLFINDGRNRPIGFNMLTIGNFAPNITDDLIRAAKMPPTAAPAVEFSSDSAVKDNNFRSKLHQFKYRWVYNDGYKSTWSPISKIAIPVSGYSVVTDTDPTQNNVINILVTGGGDDYKKIEIAGRECLGTTWSDFFLVESLDTTDYNILPGGTFTYKFYNNGAYTTINLDDSELLFSYIPDLANSQSLVNGTNLVYGGITEGYNQITRSQVNVQMGYRLVDTSANPVPGLPPNLSYNISSSPSISPTDYRLFIVLGPNVNIGDTFHVGFVTAPISGVTYTCNADYTSTTTDYATVREGIRSAIDAQLGPNFDVQLSGTDSIRIETNVFPSVGPQLYNSISVYANSPSSTLSSVAVWKWNSLYRFGLVYFDKYGKTNGVVSYMPITGDTNDFSVMTPDFEVYSGNSYAPRISIITADINHLPPSWAETFQWVRTPNLSVSKFLQYVTCQVDEDDDYIYFCIENLDQYAENNTGFIQSYQFAKGDRLRVMDVLNTSSTPRYSETYYSDDYEIVGEETRTVTDPGDPAKTGRYLKVKRPSAAIAYDSTMLIEIYTPALRNAETEQAFFEFGEGGVIYEVNGVRYHTGTKQFQNATQPAQFEFRDGDVYLKFRKIYDFHFSETLGDFSVSMMDANYSDFWQSAVNSNGRPNVIDPNAKREYNPALLRFGNTLQSGTNINGLNIFYALDYEEVNRDFGAIQKTVEWNNSLVVWQEHKVGRMPVLQALVQYADGQQSTIISQKLLNRVQYYMGEFGTGDSWESIAATNSGLYWWDNYRGANLRLAQNGIDPLSIIYNASDFALRNAVIGRKIIGVFNTHYNTYISAFQATVDLPAKTLVYNENEQYKGYECFMSFLPEMMCMINNVLVTWKNGVLYTHDSSTYNNFYGVQYDSYIKGSFNDEPVMKKTFDALTYVGTSGWSVPEIQSNQFTYGTTKRSTHIAAAEFVEEEGEFHSDIGRDTNSDGGKANGDYMKGQWATMKFTFTNASSFVYLLACLCRVTSSSKQPTQ